MLKNTNFPDSFESFGILAFSVLWNLTHCKVLGRLVRANTAEVDNRPGHGKCCMIIWNHVHIWNHFLWKSLSLKSLLALILGRIHHLVQLLEQTTSFQIQLFLSLLWVAWKHSTYITDWGGEKYVLRYSYVNCIGLRVLDMLAWPCHKNARSSKGLRCPLLS